MTSPIELITNLVVGTVESVSPNEIQVLLDLDSPHSTALNTGVPMAFPRLNGYTLIPHESGATIAYIAWIGIERSLYPKRTGVKDFGLVDLPFPLRKMRVIPVGTLTAKRSTGDCSPSYALSRGVAAFPSVGDQVLVPTAEQLKAIVTGDQSDQRLSIGTAPMSGSAGISVDPDKLFGRHLAVLGNTGSGKSCSVAGLIRWSIEAAAKEHWLNHPNARFIVLDPNGEYARAFADMGDTVRVFRPGDVANPLRVPAWMWNSSEWAAVSGAQPGTQRPLLMRALRELRAGRSLREPTQTRTTRQLNLYRARVAALIVDGNYTNWGPRQEFGKLLVSIGSVMRDYSARGLEPDEQASLEAIADYVEAKAGEKAFAYKGETAYNECTPLELERLVELLDAAIQSLPAVGETPITSEDAPIEFPVEQLADVIDDLATDGPSNANMANQVAFLTLRLRSLLANTKLAGVITPAQSLTLAEWLGSYIGSAHDGQSAQIAILDLSLVPSETLHIVVAVLARLTFEALQRYRKNHPMGKALPTVLVLEEAHNFVKRGIDDEGGSIPPARLCRESFEKIAREGRKFGLGLVLASQRPSELSPTVLAQCNTFLLHRIVNDADQELVSRLIPDNVGGLLRELPSLPSRQAILLGWAAKIPVLVEMRELPKAQQPQSDDPDFWGVWTESDARSVDWSVLAREWVGHDDLNEGKASNADGGGA